MRTQQQRIMGMIEGTVTSAGKGEAIEAVVQYAYSNTGVVYVTDNFDTVLEIHFQFDTNTMTLKLQGPVVAGASLPDNPPVYRSTERDGIAFWSLKYSEGDRLRVALDLIRDFITAWVREQVGTWPVTY